MSPQGALLVGSINLPDAETTFRTVAGTLGPWVKRIPDGEVGERFYWIIFQGDRLAQTPGLVRIGDEPVLFHGFDVRRLKIADGVDPADIVLAPLGYAEAALESWKVFERLRSEGVVDEKTRFQISLPTPIAVVDGFIDLAQRDIVEPIYRAALVAELDLILATIPHDLLAIQWDVAVEFGLIEFEGTTGARGAYDGNFTPWFTDVWPAVVSRTAELADLIPTDVEVGFHLCYGDAGEAHFVEPRDTANLTRFANELFEAAHRPLTWIHLPVPIAREDDAYYAPLESLNLPAETELYLGLVHREDGAEGASRRLAAAERHVPRFGVATECGCGRAPSEQTGVLLKTHAEVAERWA